MLTYGEILAILELLRDRYGPGYATEDTIRLLQAKLSIMAQVAGEKEKKMRALIKRVKKDAGVPRI